jgi:hypothetical protein
MRLDIATSMLFSLTSLVNNGLTGISERLEALANSNPETDVMVLVVYSQIVEALAPPAVVDVNSLVP